MELNLKILIWPRKFTSSTIDFQYLCMCMQRCMDKMFVLVLFVREYILVRKKRYTAIKKKPNKYSVDQKHGHFLFSHTGFQVNCLGEWGSLLSVGPFPSKLLSCHPQGHCRNCVVEGDPPHIHCSWCGREGRMEQAARSLWPGFRSGTFCLIIFH